MSVSTEINKKVYACDGVETEFSFPYKIFAQTDLEVWLRDTAGVLTKLTLPTHYGVSAVNNDYSNGATVTTVATYGAGNTLAIVRVVPKTQGADYVENDNFPAEGHESALDRGVMISQQIAESLSRAIKGPVEEESLDMTIPPAASRKGKWLYFEADNGEPRAAETTPTDVAVSAFMETVLDDADAVEALATLGLTISAFAKTLLDDADAAAAQTTLGISAFIKTLLNDATAAIARATLAAVGLTGNETIAGIKTFSSEIVGDISGYSKQVKEAGGTVLIPKVIEIGDWDMDTDAIKTVAHGMGADWKKIRSVTMVIRRDDDVRYYVSPMTSDGMVNHIGYQYFDATDIYLIRVTASMFDNNNFEDTGYNRGWVTLWCGE